MTRKLVAVLGAIVVGALALGAGSPIDSAIAQEAAPKAKSKKGLKGSIGYRRAYSYTKDQVVGTDTRRFYDPYSTKQSPGGPFDSGFFFDSAMGRNGGDAPYMQ